MQKSKGARALTSDRVTIPALLAGTGALSFLIDNYWPVVLAIALVAYLKQDSFGIALVLLLMGITGTVIGILLQEWLHAIVVGIATVWVGWDVWKLRVTVDGARNRTEPDGA